MAAVSLLPHANFGQNDHREDAPHITYREYRGPAHILQKLMIIKMYSFKLIELLCIVVIIV